QRDMGTLLSADDPSATLNLTAAGGPPGASSTIELSLLSADADLLLKRNARILPFLQQHAFVTSVSSSLSNLTVERDFTPNESQMEGTGISPGEIAGLLQTYASGTKAGDAQVGGQSFPIMVQIDPTWLTGGQSLLSLPIYSAAQK